MAKIFDLKIKNFKGINEFHHTFGKKNFICLIGRGDSGKTSILEAISLVLSPKWNIPFIDTDFHNCNIENEILIEAVMYDIPQKLLRESKFGLHMVGINIRTNKVENELQEEHMEALVIRLSVDKTLEPKWYIINGRDEQIEINSSDRALFKMFFISDYLDKHFSWNTGSPLYSLLKNQDNLEEFDNSVIIKSLRIAKSTIDNSNFSAFDNVIEKIKSTSKELGLNIDDVSTTVDFKEFMLKDDKVSLHENNIPLRLKGKGTKRLLSIAIQLELLKSGGIILIDEIEQGLEPDRAQHLAKILRTAPYGQIFITTHSRDVLVELSYDNLFMMKESELVDFDESLQDCLRVSPEVFFAKKILVCEGATEVGFCRAINDYRIEHGMTNMSMLGVKITDGKGANQIRYTNGFIKSKFDVCLFCDSDLTEVNEKKSELIGKGVIVCDCENLFSLEQQIFYDLPWNGIKELIEYREKVQDFSLIEAGLKNIYQTILKMDFPENWIDDDNIKIRNALGKLSVKKEKDWFKSIERGYDLGNICLNHYDKLKSEQRLKKQIDSIMEWIDNA